MDVANEAQLRGERGLAHLARGDLLRAESELRHAHIADPIHAPWLFHLARVLLRLDRDFEAMECLRHGVALLPDATCLIRLAHLEYAHGDPDKALEAALQGLHLNTADTMGHIVAAKSLSELAREEESDKHWMEAARLAAPNEHYVELERARFRREQGQFDLAIADARAIASRRPAFAGALALLAESSRAKDSDLSLLEQMEELARHKTTSPADRINLEFAIGKMYDDIDRFQDAMAWFDRANATALASNPAQSRFNRDAYARSIQARIDAFGADALSRANEVGSPDATPIFVVGMIRSGTTLIEQILSRHPLVQAAGEQKFWLGVEPAFADLPNRRIDLAALQGAASTYTRLLNRYLGDAKHVVDKQPGNLLLVGALHLAFPNARIVYMQRNPLDNAVSIWNTNIRTPLPFMHDKGNLAFAIQQHALLKRHWQTVLPADRFMVLEYESLVEDQERWTRRVADFCGLPWDDACLTPEKGASKVITPSLWQVRQPIYRTSVGRLKNYEPWLGDFNVLLEERK